MAYEFPISTAVQCIPNFSGKWVEVEPFLLIIKYFADKIPEGEDHTPLLNVVYTKLKGKALHRFPFIKDNSWPKVEKKNKRRISIHKKCWKNIK